MAIVDFLNNQFTSSSKVEEVGIGGFKLLARTNQTFTYKSQVPTAYLEDGSHASDHIVLEPLTLQIDGSVSDVYIEPEQVVAEMRNVQTVVSNFSGYLPTFAQSQLQKLNSVAVQALDKARHIDRLIDSGKQALSFLGDQRQANSVGLREKFIDSMEALHNSKALVSISMPYRVFDDMRITSIAFTQDNQREAITFSISAQKVRTAVTQFVELNELKKTTPSEALDKQTDGVTDKGVQEGKKTPRSMLGSITGIFKNQ
ncbi:MAG: hypothetical protein IBX55_08865 [Methyloprofundus sp.]|nr:hypothetical protein [Methyloprofundus sp.]